MDTFQPVSRTRVADQVANTIRDAILTGKYEPGQRLPAERELAAQFEVNRSTIREALHRLEAWNLVDVRHGGGVIVSDFLRVAGLQLLPFLLVSDGELDPDLMRDLLAVRVAFLRLTAEQAADRATTEDIADLSKALDFLDAARGIDAIARADFAFFQTLVHACGNRVLQLMFTAIGAAYVENQSQFGALYPTDTMITIAHHSAVDAIKRSDSEAAGKAMQVYAEAALAVFPR